MQPEIRYVQSADGTRIAMWALGAGPPVIVVPNRWRETIEVLWQVPDVRSDLEELAKRRTIVLYDLRGQGLSQRDVADYSFERHVDDLQAVVGLARSSPVALLGYIYGAPVAISYTAAQPERVSRLVVVNSLVRARDFRLLPRHSVLSRLAETDWEFFIQAMMLSDFEWTDVGRNVAEAWVKALSQETFLASMRAWDSLDVTTSLSKVQCPTLVMHHRGRWREPVSIDVAKEIAATIPNARLQVPETGYQLLLGDGASLRGIEQFLDEDATTAEPTLPSGTAIILFADIADSTALTERLGDDAFRANARELDGALRTVIRDHAGTPIEGKLLGDGVLAVFTSARQAIEAALACATAGDDAGLPLHLGLHAGDVIREENNVYGGAVNIASRLSGLSATGEVLVSETVRSLARTSGGVSFEDRGRRRLKGVGEPVRVWAVNTNRA